MLTKKNSKDKQALSFKILCNDTEILLSKALEISCDVVSSLHFSVHLSLTEEEDEAEQYSRLHAVQC